MLPAAGLDARGRHHQVLKGYRPGSPSCPPRLEELYLRSPASSRATLPEIAQVAHPHCPHDALGQRQDAVGQRASASMHGELDACPRDVIAQACTTLNFAVLDTQLRRALSIFSSPASGDTRAAWLCLTLAQAARRGAREKRTAKTIIGASPAALATHRASLHAA